MFIPPYYLSLIRQLIKPIIIEFELQLQSYSSSSSSTRLNFIKSGQISTIIVGLAR